jgi:hypothetical protein
MSTEGLAYFIYCRFVALIIVLFLVMECIWSSVAFAAEEVTS